MPTVSWADASENDGPIDVLSRRIADLEHTVGAELSELRNEVGLAAAAMRREGQDGPTSMLGDLEEQLARAVTVSLSAALEAIRESLTEAIGTAVQQLTSRLETTIDTTIDTTIEGLGLEEVAASLQQSVLLALSAFEESSAAQSAADPFDGPATARDVARVNQRIDELRSLLLG